jgi:uncharacterized protein
MTGLDGAATRLTVMLGEFDRWQRKPLITEIVRRAHDTGLAGATVLHGIEGFGAHSLIHTDRILSLADDLPVMIVIVDSDEKIRAFIPQLDELIAEGLVILDEVRVIRYSDGRRA